MSILFEMGSLDYETLERTYTDPEMQELWKAEREKDATIARLSSELERVTALRDMWIDKFDRRNEEFIEARDLLLSLWPVLCGDDYIGEYGLEELRGKLSKLGIKVDYD